MSSNGNPQGYLQRAYDMLTSARDDAMSELDLAKAAVAEAQSEVKRIDNALRALSPEDHPKRERKSAPRKYPKRVSPERLKDIEQACLSAAGVTGDDEFRQVDIRNLTGESSGTVTIAFAQLRDQRVIRMSRVSGNNKWFRLWQAGDTDE